MARAIRITAGQVSASAELNDSTTACASWDALPIEAKAETWGDEIYFGIPVRAEADGAKEVVALGDLGYRPASPVNVVGRVRGDVTVFKNVGAGTRVTIERGAS